MTSILHDNVPPWCACSLRSLAIVCAQSLTLSIVIQRTLGVYFSMYVARLCSNEGFHAFVLPWSSVLSSGASGDNSFAYLFTSCSPRPKCIARLRVRGGEPGRLVADSKPDSVTAIRQAQGNIFTFP